METTSGATVPLWPPATTNPTSLEQRHSPAVSSLDLLPHPAPSLQPSSTVESGSDSVSSLQHLLVLSHPHLLWPCPSFPMFLLS